MPLVSPKISAIKTSKMSSRSPALRRTLPTSARPCVYGKQAASTSYSRSSSRLAMSRSRLPSSPSVRLSLPVIACITESDASSTPSEVNCRSHLPMSQSLLRITKLRTLLFLNQSARSLVQTPSITAGASPESFPSGPISNWPSVNHNNSRHSAVLPRNCSRAPSKPER